MVVRLLLIVTLFAAATLYSQESEASSCTPKMLRVDCSTDLLGPIYNEWLWTTTAQAGLDGNWGTERDEPTARWVCFWGFSQSFTMIITAKKTVGTGISADFIPTNCLMPI